MLIYVVEPGDTLTGIGAAYGLSPERIAADNSLDPAQPLVVGQTLVLRFPVRTQTVAPGDSLFGIAQSTGVPIVTLLQNNPLLLKTNNLFPGQTLVLEYPAPEGGRISTNGYVYPYVDSKVLQQALPYLTYLTVFTYGLTPAGALIVPPDDDVVALARSYGVAPVLHLSTLGPEGVFSSELGQGLLHNPGLWPGLIAQLLAVMAQKGYVGLDVDFEFLPANTRQAYVDFLAYLREALSPRGYFVTVALPPKTAADQPGLLYEGADYRGLGAAADFCLLMAYEWGYTYGPAMAVSPLPQVQAVLDYALTEIPAEKLLLGMPNYGYDFGLPYVRGESRATSIGNVEAVDLARRVGASIRYNETVQAPYFFYTNSEGQVREVWFEDARSVEAKARLLAQNGLPGQAFWNLMRPFPQSWLVLSSLYSIERAYIPPREEATE